MAWGGSRVVIGGIGSVVTGAVVDSDSATYSLAEKSTRKYKWAENYYFANGIAIATVVATGGGGCWSWWQKSRLCDAAAAMEH